MKKTWHTVFLILLICLDAALLLLPLLPGAVCMLMSLIIEPVFREYTAEQGDENTDAWYNE